MRPDNFCSGYANQRHHLTFQILTKLCQAFPRYEPSKIGLVSSFFLVVSFCLMLFSLNNKSCHKTQTSYLIVLKIGTQQDGISAHCGIKIP